MCDNIQVAIKVRPLIQREKNDNLQCQWKVHGNSLTPVNGTSAETHTFDHVFDSNSSNYDVYEAVVSPITDAAVKGFNGTIFAYGQTSSGKTFTMIGTKTEPGIVPLVVANIFQLIDTHPAREFLLRASYIEIYNEKVHDLLDKNKNRANINIYEDVNGAVVLNVKEEVSNTPEHLLEIMGRGDKNRRIGETNMNERSSRSHTIFRIIIESRDSAEPDGAVQVAHLNLVDLAGSERISQTGATGVRLKEGTHINLSLLSLSRVINQLSDAVETPRYINFRDSKLTRLLQTSLGGNAKTVIICAITPAALEESQSTLAFASRAKSIKNKPEVNEVLSDNALIKQYAKQVKRLKEELEKEKHAKLNLLTNHEETSLMNRRLQERIALMKNFILCARKPAILASVKHDTGVRRQTWCGGPAINGAIISIEQSMKIPLSNFTPENSLPTQFTVGESESFTQEVNELAFNLNTSVLLREDASALVNQSIPLESFERELLDVMQSQLAMQKESSTSDDVVECQDDNETISALKQYYMDEYDALQDFHKVELNVLETEKNELQLMNSQLMIQNEKLQQDVQKTMLICEKIKRDNDWKISKLETQLEDKKTLLGEPCLEIRTSPTQYIPGVREISAGKQIIRSVISELEQSNLPGDIIKKTKCLLQNHLATLDHSIYALVTTRRINTRLKTKINSRKHAMPAITEDEETENETDELLNDVSNIKVQLHSLYGMINQFGVTELSFQDAISDLQEKSPVAETKLIKNSEVATKLHESLQEKLMVLERDLHEKSIMVKKLEDTILKLQDKSQLIQKPKETSLECQDRAQTRETSVLHNFQMILNTVEPTATLQNKSLIDEEVKATIFELPENSQEAEKELNNKFEMVRSMEDITSFFNDKLTVANNELIQKTLLVEELQVTNSQLNETVQMVRNELLKNTEIIADLQKATSGLQEKTHVTEMKLQEKTDIVDNLQEMINELRDKLHGTEKELHVKSGMIENLKHRTSDLQEQALMVQKLQQTIVDLEEKSQVSEKQHSERIQHLQETILHLQKEAQVCYKLQESVLELQERSNIAEKELLIKSDIIKSLEEMVSDLQLKVQNAEDASQEESERVKHLQETILDLEKEVEMCQQLQESVLEFQERSNMAEKELLVKSDIIKSFEEMVLELQLKVQNAEDDSEEKSRLVQNLQEIISKSPETLQAATEQLCEKSDSSEMLLHHPSDVQDKYISVQKLPGTIKEFQEILQLIENEVFSKSEIAMASQKMILDLQQKIRTAEEQVQEKSLSVQNLQAIICETQKILEVTEERLCEKSALVKTLEEKLSTLQEISQTIPPPQEFSQELQERSHVLEKELLVTSKLVENLQENIVDTQEKQPRIEDNAKTETQDRFDVTEEELDKNSIVARNLEDERRQNSVMVEHLQAAISEGHKKSLIIQMLENTIADNEIEKCELNLSSNSYKEQNNTLIEESKLAAVKIQTQCEQIVSLRDQMSILSKQIAAQSVGMDKLEADLKQQLTTNNDLLKKIFDLKNEYQEELAESRAMVEDMIIKNCSDIEEYETKIAVEEDKVRSLQATVEAFETERRALRELRSVDQNMDITCLKQERDQKVTVNTESRCTSMTDLIFEDNSIAEMMNDLKMEALDLNKKLLHVENLYKKTNDDYITLLSVSEQQTLNNESIIRSLRSKIDVLTQQVSFTDSTEHYKKQILDYKNQIIELSDQLKESQTQVEILNEDLLNAKLEAEKLNQEITIQKMHKCIEETETQVLAVSNTENMAVLEQQLAEIERRNEDKIATQETIIAELRKHIFELESQIESLLDNINMQTNKITKLEEFVQQNTFDRTGMEGLVENLMTEKESHAKLIEDLQQKLLVADTIQKEYGNQGVIIASLRSQYEENRLEITFLKEKICTLSQQMTETELEHDKMLSEKLTLETTLETQKEELNNVMEQLAEINKAHKRGLDEQQDVFFKHKEEMEKSEKENNMLNEFVSTLTHKVRSLEEMNETIKHDQSRINLLNEELLQKLSEVELRGKHAMEERRKYAAENGLLGGRIKHLTRQLNETEANRKEEIAEMLQAKEAIEQELEMVKQKLITFTNQASGLEMENEQLMTQVGILTKEIRETEQRFEIVRQENKHIQIALEEKLQLKNMEIETLRCEAAKRRLEPVLKSESKSEKEDVSHQLNLATLKVTELESVNLKIREDYQVIIDKLKQQIAEKDLELQSLKREVITKDNIMKKIEIDHTKEIEYIGLQISNKQASPTKSVGNPSDRTIDTENEIEQLKLQIRQTVHDYNEKIKTIQAELNSKRSLIKNLLTDRKQHSCNILILKRQLEALGQENNTLKEQFKTLANEKDEAIQKFKDHYEHVVNEIESTKDRYEKQILDANNMMKNNTMQYERLKVSYDERIRLLMRQLSDERSQAQKLAATQKKTNTTLTEQPSPKAFTNVSTQTHAALLTDHNSRSTDNYGKENGHTDDNCIPTPTTSKNIKLQAELCALEKALQEEKNRTEWFKSESENNLKQIIALEEKLVIHQGTLQLPRSADSTPGRDRHREQVKSRRQSLVDDVRKIFTENLIETNTKKDVGVNTIEGVCMQQFECDLLIARNQITDLQRQIKHLTERKNNLQKTVLPKSSRGTQFPDESAGSVGTNKGGSVEYSNNPNVCGSGIVVSYHQDKVREHLQKKYEVLKDILRLRRNRILKLEEYANIRPDQEVPSGRLADPKS